MLLGVVLILGAFGSAGAAASGIGRGVIDGGKGAAMGANASAGTGFRFERRRNRQHRRYFRRHRRDYNRR
jgi:hypothetical protein